MQRTWFKHFTKAELAEWKGKTKVCPRCQEAKDIIEGFGIRKCRYPYDPPSSKRRRTCVSSYCFACASRASQERIQRNQPEKFAARLAYLRELEKTPEMRAKKAAYRKEWGKRTQKNREYHNNYIKRHPLRHLARLMARFAYPTAQPCTIAGCGKPGIRHHAD